MNIIFHVQNHMYHIHLLHLLIKFYEHELAQFYLKEALPQKFLHHLSNQIVEQCLNPLKNYQMAYLSTIV